MCTCPKCKEERSTKLGKEFKYDGIELFNVDYLERMSKIIAITDNDEEPDA